MYVHNNAKTCLKSRESSLLPAPDHSAACLSLCAAWRATSVYGNTSGFPNSCIVTTLLKFVSSIYETLLKFTGQKSNAFTPSKGWHLKALEMYLQNYRHIAFWPSGTNAHLSVTAFTTYNQCFYTFVFVDCERSP